MGYWKIMCFKRLLFFSERAMVILYGGLLCVSHYMNVICGRISLDDAYRRISTVLSRLIGCRIKMW